MSSDGVKSEVTYREDMTVSLTLSLDWTTNCFPLLTVELAEEGREEGGKVTHSRLVPRVTSDRQLHLTLPLEGPDNTHYTAQLTSISDQRELTVETPISFSQCVCVCVCVCAYMCACMCMCKYDSIDALCFHDNMHASKPCNKVPIAAL